MRKKPAASYARWGHADDAALKKAAKRKAAQAIAKKLQRSESAVRQRAWTMGLSLRHH